MTTSAVSPMLNALFNIARVNYAAEYVAWIKLSYLLSGRFRLPMAMLSIQRQGDLDVLLRCLEDEYHANKDELFTLHYQLMFAETWVVGCYEFLRAFRDRDDKAPKAGKAKSGVSDLDEFKSIFSDLELLRMPIAKFQIAKDRELGGPVPMERVGCGVAKPIEFYDPKDPDRFHIMPRGPSARGSATWLVIDGRNKQQHWVERRELADRLLSLIKIVKGAGELEAEQNSSSSVSDKSAPR